MMQREWSEKWGRRSALALKVPKKHLRLLIRRQQPLNRPIVRARTLASCWLLALIAVGPVGPVSAGPFEDGSRAYEQKDYTTAFRLWLSLAEQGNARAQFNVALMYQSGRGVTKDIEQAAHWYRKAAEQGDAEAHGELARTYASGDGVPKDYTQALIWAEKGAELGDPLAQRTLGTMYESGHGVAKNDERAVHWYRRAAQQGEVDAQLRLGLKFERGVGVPKDEQQAYFWWLLASAQGNKYAAHNRDLLERSLAPSQRGAAQAQARNWKPVLERRDSPEGVAGSSRPSASGTGFRISPGRFVTNHHVVQGCLRLRVNGSLAAKVQAGDSRNDIALLAVNGDRGPVATIRSGPIRLGEDVTVVGFPLEGLFSGVTVTTGTISRLSGIGGDSRLVQISAPVQPGNSGGPLLDSRGAVVGVVSSKLDAVTMANVTGDIPQNVNFALKTSVLKAFLDSVSVGYQMSSSGTQLSSAVVASRAKEYTALIECWQ